MFEKAQFNVRGWEGEDILGTKRQLSKARYFTAKFVTILRLDLTCEVEHFNLRQVLTKERSPELKTCQSQISYIEPQIFFDA